MQILFVVLLSCMLLLGGWLNSQRTDPTNSHNLPLLLARNTADNIFYYTATAKQYAERESALTNTRISDENLLPYFNYPFTKLGDYAGVILSYKQNKYLLVSWNRLFKIPTSNRDVMSSLVKISGLKQGYGSSTYWQIPIIIMNNNCTATIMNNFLKPINENLAGYNLLFSDLCNLSRTQLNVMPGQFVILTQVAKD